MPPPLRTDARPGIVHALLAPSRTRIEFCVRATVTSVLVTIVAATYATPLFALTAFLSFMMIKTTRTDSILIAVVFLALVTVVVAIVMFTAALVLDRPFWRIVSMAFLSIAILFFGASSKAEALAPAAALIVGTALDEIGNVQAGEAAVRALLYIWLAVAIPAGAAIAVNLLIGPAPLKCLQREIASRLRAAADVLDLPSETHRSRCRSLLRQSDTAMRKLLKLAVLERSLASGSASALSRAIASSVMVLTLVDLLDDPDGAIVVPEMRTALAATMREMAAIFEQGSHPVDVVPPPAVSGNGYDDRGRVLVERLNAALAEFAEGGAAPPARREQARFFHPDIATNPGYMRYALKTTAAAMICYLLYQQLDWSGIHTCVVTCYLVSLGTLGETVEKLTLRIVGAAMGAAIGLASLLFVVPHITSIGGLVLTVAPVSFLAAWILDGGPRISYAGLQLALAYFLYVLEHPYPAFDLALGRDRLIGILLGNVVTFYIFTRVAPVSLIGGMEAQIRALLKALADRALGGRWRVDDPALADERARITELAAKIEVARHEPADFRPSASWFLESRRTLERLERVLGPFMLSARRDDIALAARFDELADATDGSRPRGPRPRPASVPGDPWRPVLDQEMNRLDALVSQGDLGNVHARR